MLLILLIVLMLMRKKKCRISREKREEEKKTVIIRTNALLFVVECCMCYPEFFVPRYILLVNTFDDARSIWFIIICSVGIAHDINPIDAGDL
jgi:hypothetical protein